MFFENWGHSITRNIYQKGHIRKPLLKDLTMTFDSLDK